MRRLTGNWKNVKRACVFMSALTIVLWIGSLFYSVGYSQYPQGLTWSVVLGDGFLYIHRMPWNHLPPHLVQMIHGWHFDSTANCTSTPVHGLDGVRAWRNTGGRLGAEIPIWVVALFFALIAGYVHLRGRAVPGHCPTCDYNLTGNQSGTCPECGTVIRESAIPTATP